MNDNFLNIKDQQVLYQIKEFLETISVDSTVIESSAQLPINILLAVTPELVTVNIMYVPLPEDHFTEIRLLQHYTLVVEKVIEERKTDLFRLLNEMNNQSPLGSFGVNDKGELGFKYIYPVSRFDMLKEDPFLETFSLYLNCLMGFRKTIINVNNGTLPVEDALKDVMAR